jgi:hypothetical protein
VTAVEALRSELLRIRESERSPVDVDYLLMIANDQIRAAAFRELYRQLVVIRAIVAKCDPDVDEMDDALAEIEEIVEGSVARFRRLAR